jgi:hypothetical protein
MSRIEITHSQLRDALTEQVTLLVSHCKHYDEGELAFAKAMATVLRICLHHRGNSKALLHQLNLRNGRFYCASGRPSPRAIPVGCSLVSIAHSNERGGHYAPVLRSPLLKERLNFSDWWNGVILRAPTGQTMCRRDIITAVADMDGGAHIDPTIEPTYAAFRSGELLRMRTTQNSNGEITMFIPIVMSAEFAEKESIEGLLKSPQYPSVRTIAHEFLITLQRYAPWAFITSYVAMEPFSIHP